MSRAQGLAVAVILVGIAVGMSAFLSGRLQPAGTPDARAGEPEAAPAVADTKRVYTSPLAEMGWYSRDPQRLGDEIQGYLDAATGEPPPAIMALILPHAGYRYSGPVAAWGVKQVAGKRFTRVIVIGASHRPRGMNTVSVPEYTHYATPLGEIPLDLEFIRAFKMHSVVQPDPRAHHGEHCVQIELPLLQKALGAFRLVPIIVQPLDLATVERLAAVLRGFVGPETLVVASSDFTHYGEDYGYVPFTEDVAAKLKTLDMGAVAAIEKRDAEGFLDYCEETGATICGRSAIAVLLAMLPADARATRLRYDTSGRMEGRYDRSVSYVSLAFAGTWPAGTPVVADASTAALADADKTAVLKLARDCIAFALAKERVAAEKDVAYVPTPNARKVMGAFVTLHKHGRLRGCIGEITPRRPLYQAVMAQAVNSAFQDWRFPQVKADELPDLVIEISALTPPRPIASCKEIVLGTHGVVLTKGERSAVFLPQVAPEQGWDLETTLTQLALKAGLAADDWKEGASFTVFEAIVFREAQEGRSSPRK